MYWWKHFITWDHSSKPDRKRLLQIFGCSRLTQLDCQGSSVRVVSWLHSGRRRNRGWILYRSKRSSPSPTRPGRPWGLPNFLSSGYRELKRSGPEADYSPPSTAVVKVRVAILSLLRMPKRRGKGKAVPLQAWSGAEDSRKLRFPDFMTTAPDGGKVVSLTHRPPLPPGNTPGTHFR